MSQPRTLGDGRYKILHKLGDSHYSGVYEAHDTKCEERVAIKVLHLTDSQRSIAEAMFQREVGALRDLAHPAIVRMLEHFSEATDDRLCIVLELIPGGLTLEALISQVAARKTKPQSLRWRVEQIIKLLGGLDQAHRRHIIHRDVKLANILYHQTENCLKLADFGIARLLENYARGKTGRTLREFYTRPFAAPEQIQQQDTTFATDIYAVSLVAVSLLTWQIPPAAFIAGDLQSFIKPLAEEIRDPPTFQRFQSLLAECLHSEAAQRPKIFQIVALFQELLERFAERVAIPVQITDTARNPQKHNLRTSSAMFDDLNEGLRGRYESKIDQDNSTETFVVRLYGKSLWALAKPDSADPERLVLVDAGRNQPNIHAKQREAAHLLPYSLSNKDGSASELINFLFHKYEEERIQDEARRRKESLLKVAQHVLEMQRQRLTRLCIKYLVERKKGAKEEPADPELYEIKGDILKLKILKVVPWVDAEDNGFALSEPRAELDADLEPTWAESLGDNTHFLLEGDLLGSYHGYDATQKILSVRVKSRRRIPTTGSLEYKDIAQDAALRRQERAIQNFLNDECVNPNLGHFLLYPEENELADITPRELLQSLEPKEEMSQLIERVLSTRDFFLIQGPPGTGKTTTIAEVMAQILSANPRARILLTSQSNEAVNNALDELRRLSKQINPSWRLLRDVREQRKGDESQQGFETLFREWVVRTRRQSESALFQQGSTMAPAQRKSVDLALTAWRERLDRVEDVRLDYAESVQVFGVTCLRVPTLWNLLREVRFDWVIVDEAGRATPSEVLVSLVAGQRFVLVGDHRQLPPFLDEQTEQDLRDADIDPARARRSLFEELFDKINPDCKKTLVRQYRMHRSIGEFVGELFYSDIGGLATGVSDEARTISLKRFNRTHRVFWVDVKGQEQREVTSFSNQREVDVICRLLAEMDAELSAADTKYTVGIIAPYAAQIERLRRYIIPTATRWSSLKIRINTVDAFQGKQDDIIIYSMVRIGEQERRFVADRRRLNVAFSRARRLLVIVGHKQSAQHSDQIAAAIRLIPRDNVLSEDKLS